jgi:transporter family protein
MRPYVLFAILAGFAWGIGGYFEKAGLRDLGIPPIAGIALRTAIALIILGLLSVPAWKTVANPSNMRAWVMIAVGGGIVAGSLGMWAFYSALATSENLGVTLAIAFAMSPVAGTLLGLVRRTQPMDGRIALGLVLVIAGIVLIQLSHRPAHS